MKQITLIIIAFDFLLHFSLINIYVKIYNKTYSKVLFKAKLYEEIIYCRFKDGDSSGIKS